MVNATFLFARRGLAGCFSPKRLYTVHDSFLICQLFLTSSSLLPFYDEELRKN